MKKKPLIWLAEDDDSLRWVIEQHILQNKQSVQTFDNAYDLLAELSKSKRKPDVIITDIKMSKKPKESPSSKPTAANENENNLDGLSLTSKVASLKNQIPVIVITAYNDLNTTVNAYKNGAFEFLAKPFDLEALDDVIEKALESIEKLDDANESIEQKNTIIGDSPAIQQVFQVIGKLSKSHMNVLIYGESGTGKELVATAIHQNSPRSKGPFIALNTAAIPNDLLEAELFGHEKGAFAGAISESKGHFERATNGTLFLDEIGDMPLSLQTRLLRVLQDGQFYRVGGRQLVHSNTRIIAATNQNLPKLVEQGLFREDLYHRINVMTIELPPLRDRAQDIPKLSEHFLNEATTELGSSMKSFNGSAMKKLQDFHWPGNIRQLENLCIRLSAMIASNTLTVDDLPEEIAHQSRHISPIAIENRNEESWQTLLRKSTLTLLENNNDKILKTLIDDAEFHIIGEALKFNNGNKLKTSKLLGCGRTTLDRKIIELNIDMSDD